MAMLKEKPSILIIGGIGPWASLSLHKKILRKFSSFDAKNDSYPKIIHISANIPDFIDSSDEDARKSLAAIEKQLADFKNIRFDIGIIACNTMHIFFNEINSIFDNQLLNIVDMAKEQIEDGEKIGILGTPFTIRHDMYQDERYHSFYLDDIYATKRIIDRLIASENDKSTDLLVEELKNLRNCGADKVILGCTELSILNKDELRNKLAKEGLPGNFLIDPIQIFLDRSL